MERKKVLVFETTKTLMRAFELALRCSNWAIVKIQQEGRLFPAIESASPDAVIVEYRALSAEMREALLTLPLPIIFCTKDKGHIPAGRICLARPFSCDELFEALNASLEWNPDMVTAAEEALATEEEEPFVLTMPEEEESPSVIPMEEETPVVPEPEAASLPQPVSEPPHEPLRDAGAEPVDIPAAEPVEPSAVTEAPMFVEQPLSSEPSVTSPEESSLIARVAQEVETRVVEELVPEDTAIPEGSALPEMVRALVRRELHEVMKEYFWEEAPIIMRQVLEEEIRKLAARQ